MNFRFSILLGAFILITSCATTRQPLVNLNSQQWIHGAANCELNNDPPIQVVQYNRNTWILRQNKCTNYEAPFIFLFIGKKKALLMDTGATENKTTFPLFQTVNKILDEWSKKNRKVELIVAHTHKHGDHFAADGQFKGKQNTTVIGLEVADVQNFFKITNWPDDIGTFDLGDRKMKIIPIPGHEASSIAVYDPSTKLLLTGDTFYPGRLYVQDWIAFKLSIDRLLRFSNNHKVSVFLGNHIEMTQTPGVDYPIGTIYQPNEHPLPLDKNDLRELHEALKIIGDTPKMDIHDNFIIFPVNG